MLLLPAAALTCDLSVSPHLGVGLLLSPEPRNYQITEGAEVPAGQDQLLQEDSGKGHTQCSETCLWEADLLSVNQSIRATSRKLAINP